MGKSLPSPELLHKLLRYNPETGDLFWRERTPDMFTSNRQAAEHSCAVWNAKFAHKEALTSPSNGYRRGIVLGRHHLAHRVAWAMHHGGWPQSAIDHVNGVRCDNRITNLRDVDQSTNMRNAQRMKNNTSGQTGVSWGKANNKWIAYISVSGKRKHLGFFTDISDAVAARKAAELEHGYHPNHGR